MFVLGRFSGATPSPHPIAKLRLCAWAVACWVQASQLSRPGKWSGSGFQISLAQFLVSSHVLSSTTLRVVSFFLPIHWLKEVQVCPPKMPEICMILIAILYMFGQAMNSCTPFLGLLWLERRSRKPKKSNKVQCQSIFEGSFGHRTGSHLFPCFCRRLDCPCSFDNFATRILRSMRPSKPQRLRWWWQPQWHFFVSFTGWFVTTCFFWFSGKFVSNSFTLPKEPLTVKTPQVGYFTGHWSTASKMYQEQFEVHGKQQNGWNHVDKSHLKKPTDWT